MNRTVKNNPCTICGKPGIPGLIRGSGKCQAHWNAGAFGTDPQSAARLEHLTAHLTAIKNNETEQSARASLEVWIECMNGDHSIIPEIAEYLALKRGAK